jgi:membrane protein insertase Oxa1/YidC/SpoIIIJ
MLGLGLLSTAVYLGGAFFVKQIGEDSNDALKKSDKSGALLFVIVVAVFILLYWILDIFLGNKLAGLIVIVVFIVLNFILS